jgi:hypothetical protein
MKESHGQRIGGASLLETIKRHMEGADNFEPVGNVKFA